MVGGNRNNGVETRNNDWIAFTAMTMVFRALISRWADIERGDYSTDESVNLRSGFFNLVYRLGTEQQQMNLFRTLTNTFRNGFFPTVKFWKPNVVFPVNVDF